MYAEHWRPDPRHDLIGAAGDGLAIAAFGQPAERHVADGVAQEPHAAIGQDELASAGMPASEPQEAFLDGRGAGPGIFAIGNQRTGRRWRRRERGRAGAAAEGPRELTVVNAAVLVLAPAHDGPDVLLADQQRIA